MSTVIYISGKTQGGLDWIPRFVQTINPDTCIGCGRCYKVCGREVLTLVEAELDEEENQRMIMTVENPQNCVGCEACAKVCTKKCHTHAPTPEA